MVILNFQMPGKNILLQKNDLKRDVIFVEEHLEYL